MADHTNTVAGFVQGLIAGLLIVVFTQSWSIYQEHERLLGIVFQLQDEIRQNSVILKSVQQMAASGLWMNVGNAPSDRPLTTGLSFEIYDRDIALIESDDWQADAPIWGYYVSAKLLVKNEATWTAMGKGLAQQQNSNRAQITSTLQNVTLLAVNHDKLGNYQFMLDFSSKQLAFFQQFDKELQKEQADAAKNASEVMSKGITGVLAEEPTALAALDAIERHCIKVEVGLVAVVLFFFIELSWFFLRIYRRTKSEEIPLQQKSSVSLESDKSKPVLESDPEPDAGLE